MARTNQTPEFAIEVDGAPYVWRLQRQPQWSSDTNAWRGMAIAVRHKEGQREAVVEFPPGPERKYGAPHLQAAIGRVQDDALIARGTEMLRGAGVTSLNFDLMYGLPGQTLADLEATLRRTVELGADRIALFGYAHVPHLIPRQRRIDAHGLPGQAERFAMAQCGYDLLVGADGVHSPLRTRWANAAIRSNTSCTSGTTSWPSTNTCAPAGARSAVCSTARRSVVLIASPANIASRRASRPTSCASCTSASPSAASPACRLACPPLPTASCIACITTTCTSRLTRTWR